MGNRSVPRAKGGRNVPTSRKFLVCCTNPARNCLHLGAYRIVKCLQVIVSRWSPPNKSDASESVAMQRGRFSPGDPVIYRKFKHSSTPGPRAKCVDPAPRGEDYAYSIDKFWVVVELRAENCVLLETRRGKQHVVESTDPNLRHARWWEKLLYRERFPKPANPETSSPT